MMGQYDFSKICLPDIMAAAISCMKNLFSGIPLNYGLFLLIAGCGHGLPQPFRQMEKVTELNHYT